MSPTPRGPRWSERRRFLEETTGVAVRFQEVDTTRVVWHGHYLTYFELARRAFGRRWDLDYPLFLDQGVIAPLVHVEADYRAPARLDDALEATARLVEPESAKLEFEYEIVRPADGRLLATGASVQVFTDLEGTLLLTPPAFLAERLTRWEPSWKPPRKPAST
jgi:acyl-CoA thioester hydrolase